MYTMPCNIVQSVLLRGPITAQTLGDSPYPYRSPSQLHVSLSYNVVSRHSSCVCKGKGKMEMMV
jgi:hypothetical protein